MLGSLIREINATNAEIKAIRVDLLQFFPQLLKNGLLACNNNLHACEYETSLLLYLKEELVHKERIEDSIPAYPRDFLNYGSIFKYSKNGVWGASLATVEKGKLIFEALVQESMAYIKEV